jgi:hypothetical protein
LSLLVGQGEVSVDKRRWLSSRRSVVLLNHLEGRVSPRKLRLFACAVARLLPRLRSGAEHQEREAAIQVAERFADGLATEAELRQVGRCSAGGSTWTICFPSAWEAASYCARVEADLLRDIFGNPFRTVRLARQWLTPDVVALARAAYEERLLPRSELDGARLGVLADALEEAGCWDQGVLDHLRGCGPHVRGCFAVDALLGQR